MFLEKLRAQGPPDDFIHRLLGHPDQIQGDMQVDSEMMATGLCYDSLHEPASRSQSVRQCVLNRSRFAPMGSVLADANRSSRGTGHGDIVTRTAELL